MNSDSSSLRNMLPISWRQSFQLKTRIFDCWTRAQGPVPLLAPSFDGSSMNRANQAEFQLRPTRLMTG